MTYTLMLEVPEDVYESLRKTAGQTGQSPEALAAQWLATASRNLADDPLEQFIGAFRSQGAGWADRHDEYLGQALMDKVGEPRGSADA